jgi:enoyl-CoA hydratase
VIEPLLYELHDRAKERGVEGYRRMSRAELLEVVGEEVVPSGPTVVEREVRSGLAVLTLRGADNTLGLDTLEALADAVEELARDEEVRLVAITGAGRRIFSAGADLRAIEGLRGTEVTARGTAAIDRIAAAAVPTVALLNGHAVGGAIDLALACDWRFAADGAKLRFIHNELGYSPPWGGAARLARVAGRHVALRLFATCDLASVQEARALGIVDDVVAPARLRARAEALHTRIARADRAAVAATKRLLDPGPTPSEAAAAFAMLWDARAATLPA